MNHSVLCFVLYSKYKQHEASQGAMRCKRKMEKSAWNSYLNITVWKNGVHIVFISVREEGINLCLCSDPWNSGKLVNNLIIQSKCTYSHHHLQDEIYAAAFVLNSDCLQRVSNSTQWSSLLTVVNMVLFVKQQLKLFMSPVVHFIQTLKLKSRCF